MKQQQSVYLTYPKMPALVHGILIMPRPSSLGGGVLGLFLLTWVSLWSQVAPATTIFNQPGPFTGSPIATTTYRDSDALDLAVTDFTISACVYQTTRNLGFSSGILTKRGATNGWALLLNGEAGDGPTGTVKFRTGGLVRSGQTLNTYTWYHVAVVYQAGQATIYINGAPDGTKAIPQPVATEKVLRLGEDYDYAHGNEAFRWRGTLSNLLIDNTAFSQAQIQTLSKNCTGITPPPPPPPPVGPTYNPATGELYIPQLSIIGSTQTCNPAYLQQQPFSSLFLLDYSRSICK